MSIRQGFRPLRNGVFRRTLSLIKHYILAVVDKLAALNNSQTNKNTVLIIRLDAIGDYVLFRNLLPYIRNSERFKNYKITLCGNIVWKDIAVTFDSYFVDEFIWIDTNKFYNKLMYRYNTLKTIHEKAFGVAIQTASSHNYYICDAVAKCTNAPLRICHYSNYYSSTISRKLNPRIFYHMIIESDSIEFEFNKNKYFIEQVLGTNVEITKPIITLSAYDSKYNNSQYVVIFPGASSTIKTWPENNFSVVINYILSKYDYKVIIAGSNAEKAKAQHIISLANSSKIIDMTGETTLPELAYIISRSKLLISNETSAIHIAVAVDTPVICISNGNHFGRFHPYPTNLHTNSHYVYPSELDSSVAVDDRDILKKLYSGKLYFDIDTIPPETVERLIEKQVEQACV